MLLTSNEFFEPRVEKQGITNASNPSQVAVTVYHYCLKSLKIMREFKDQGIDKDLYVVSECVKCIIHNHPYEAVERIEKKVKDM